MLKIRNLEEEKKKRALGQGKKVACASLDFNFFIPFISVKSWRMLICSSGGFAVLFNEPNFQQTPSRVCFNKFASHFIVKRNGTLQET